MRSPDAARFVVHADRPSITASKRAAQKNEGGIVMCVVPTNVADEPRQARDVGRSGTRLQTRDALERWLKRFGSAVSFFTVTDSSESEPLQIPFSSDEIM